MSTIKYTRSTYPRVHWRKNAQVIFLQSDEEWNNKVKFFTDNGHKVVATRYNSIAYWYDKNSYKIDNRSNSVKCIYASNVDGYDSEYVIFKSYVDEDKRDRTSAVGKDAFDALKEEFLADTGYTIKYAFGYTPIDFNDYCPGAIQWYDIHKADRLLRRVRKADISSAYPYQGCKKLPTYNGAIEVNGRVKPTKEYPFAFYKVSHHVAILDEFDTHDYANHKFADCFLVKERRDRLLQTRNIPDDQEVTILMKESEFTLADIMNKWYDAKSSGLDEYKQRLVAMIGYMHSINVNKGRYMGHIAAVILLRNNIRIIELYEKLLSEGCEPFQIAVDSISWIGPTTDIPDREKKLGAFYLEYENVTECITANGNYAIEKDSKILLYKHQGNKKTVKDIKKVTDIIEEDKIKRIYNNKTNMYETVEVFI